MDVDFGHEELDARDGNGNQPDTRYCVVRFRRGNSRFQRICYRYEPVDTDRHVGGDAHRDGEELKKEHDRTHRPSEDPRAQDDHSESEWDAEDAHDEIGHGQVDQKRPDICATPLASGKHRNRQYVAKDGSESRRTVDDYQNAFHFWGQVETVVRFKG